MGLPQQGGAAGNAQALTDKLDFLHLNVLGTIKDASMTPKKAPVLDPGAVAKKQKDAQAKAAIDDAGAYGNSDTLLTGPKGIGTVPGANLKTYLGQ